MTRPDHPTVADVLAATSSVAARHDELAEQHRQAFEDAAGDDASSVDSPSTESTALGY